MEDIRLQAMSYAEGFVEDFISQYIEELDEERDTPKTFEQAEKLKLMWATLSTGIAEQRREIRILHAKVAQANAALS